MFEMDRSAKSWWIIKSIGYNYVIVINSASDDYNNEKYWWNRKHAIVGNIPNPKISDECT